MSGRCEHKLGDYTHGMRFCEKCRATETDVLRSEVERLREERNAAFLMSRCECGINECCENLVSLHRRIAALEKALTEAVDSVRTGEARQRWMAVLKGGAK